MRIIPVNTSADSTTPNAKESSKQVLEWVQTIFVWSHGHVWMPCPSLQIFRHPSWQKTFFWTERARKWPRHKICKQLEDGTENLRCLTCNVVEIKQGCWNAPCFQLWACYTASWPRNHMFSGVSFTLKARNQVLHHSFGIMTMEWDAETNVLWVDTN